MNEMIRCIKNIAIAGGLHQMAAFGAGSLNHDAADCELRSKAETLAAPPPLRCDFSNAWPEWKKKKMTKSNLNAGSPSPAMLNPTNHCLAFIDAVALMSFSVSNTSRDELRNKVAIVANAAKIFNVPTVVSTVSTAAFISPVFQEIIDVYPDLDAYVPRTSMNAWEEPGFYRAVTSKNKKKIVLAGLRTGVCINGATLSAINEGYEVYIITDACGDVTTEAHERAVTRMVQAGAQPITAIQYLLELQRDWARTETVPAVGELVQRYAGIFGLVLHDISHKPVKQITYRSWRNIKVFPSKAVNEGSPFSLPLFTALICKA